MTAVGDTTEQNYDSCWDTTEQDYDGCWGYNRAKLLQLFFMQQIIIMTAVGYGFPLLFFSCNTA